MTMTLELSEEMQRKLQAAAARQQLSPEDVLLKLADKYLEEDAPDAEAHRQAVKAAGDYVQRKNAELYERLA